MKRRGSSPKADDRRKANGEAEGDSGAGQQRAHLLSSPTDLNTSCETSAQGVM
jgi:hypothetical protein